LAAISSGGWDRTSREGWRRGGGGGPPPPGVWTPSLFLQPDEGSPGAPERRDARPPRLARQAAVRSTCDARARGPHQAPHGLVRRRGEGRRRRRPRPYASCAMVNNSGVLLAREHDALIDAHDLVIRLNNAPAGDDRYARHVVCVTAWFAETGGLRQRWRRWLRSAAGFAGGRAEARAVYSTNLIDNKTSFIENFCHMVLLFWSVDALMLQYDLTYLSIKSQ
jgi:hypothetical protein